MPATFSPLPAFSHLRHPLLEQSQRRAGGSQRPTPARSS
jgi:hypothetical protein